MSELLDAEAMKKAAFAVFAKANENNLKPETIKSLWPSQHYPHWDGLAEAAIRAYLEAAPSPSPAPGVVDALTAAKDFIALEYADARQEQYGEWLAPEARKVFGLICEALASLSQHAKAEQAVTEDWQPIDTAPHGVPVLLYTPPFACMGADAKHEMRVGCASWGEVIGGISNRSFDGHATYWRPLPNPPSALKAAMEAGGQAAAVKPMECIEVTADAIESLAAQVAELRAENDKLLDDHEARVLMHHAVEHQYDHLHSAAIDLIETVDGAYPGNAWTAEIKRTIRDISDGLIS